LSLPQWRCCCRSQALRGFCEIRYKVLGSSVVQLTVKATATTGAFAVGLGLEGYVLATLLANLVGMLWMALGLKRKLHELLAEASKPCASFPEWRRYAAVRWYSMGLLGVASGRLEWLFRNRPAPMKQNHV
jgi:hypothetical protein